MIPGTHVKVREERVQSTWLFSNLHVHTVTINSQNKHQDTLNADFQLPEPRDKVSVASRHPASVLECPVPTNSIRPFADESQTQMASLLKGFQQPFLGGREGGGREVWREGGRAHAHLVAPAQMSLGILVRGVPRAPSCLFQFTMP